MQKGLYTSRLMISQRLQELKKDAEKVQEINNKYLKLCKEFEDSIRTTFYSLRERLQGEYLIEIMDRLNLTPKELSSILSKSFRSVNKIINEEKNRKDKK